MIIFVRITKKERPIRMFRQDFRPTLLHYKVFTGFVVGVFVFLLLLLLLVVNSSSLLNALIITNHINPTPRHLSTPVGIGPAPDFDERPKVFQNGPTIIVRHGPGVPIDPFLTDLGLVGPQLGPPLGWDVGVGKEVPPLVGRQSVGEKSLEFVMKGVCRVVCFGSASLSRHSDGSLLCFWGILLSFLLGIALVVAVVVSGCWFR
mmetsp:Transcript_10233/g.28202  ORF Transcript_10233/g.28202 Transcript_10233/m.28202 type:complete len:204 (-) Transcript_10233:319-930(-)